MKRIAFLVQVIILAVLICTIGTQNESSARAVNGNGLGSGSTVSLIIIEKGDSRTAGMGMTQQQVYGYVGVLTAPFIAGDPTFFAPTDVFNLGLSGETIYAVSINQNGTGGPFGNGYDLSAMLTAITRTPANKVPIISFWEGTNDLAGYAPSPLASVALTNLETVSNYLHTNASRAFKLLCFTEIDRTASFTGGVTQSSYEIQQALFNFDLKSTGTSVCDEIYDLGASPVLGCPNCGANLTYFQDGVHPTIYSHANIIAPPWVPFALNLGR